MERERVIESIKKASKSVSELSSESSSEQAVHRVLKELLSFCEEAAIRIDDATKKNKPIRFDLLLSVLGDIRKDASMVDMLLKLDPTYDDVRTCIAEGVAAFSDYATSKLKTAVVLMPLSDNSIVH